MSDHPDDTVHTIDDLRSAWSDTRRLGLWWHHELVVMFIDSDGVPCRWRVDLRRLSGEPKQEMIERLLERIGYLARKHFEGGSVAILTSMTKRGLADERELQWCRMLRDGLDEAPFRSWPLFHASRGCLGIVPPDALVA